MSSSPARPVFLLTGFLGSGKTTLLNKLLERDAFSNTLVIVNEFGEIGLDHLLVETSSDTILELSNGCLCCSVRGELVNTLLDLDPSQFERVIIETTGIADPLPVFQSLAAQPELAKRFKPTSILTVLDAIRGASIIETHAEARSQLALADLVFLSKLDLRDSSEPALDETIRTLNPNALIVSNPFELTPQLLEQKIAPVHPSTAHVAHSHATNFRSVVLETDRVLSTQLIAGLLHHFANMLGEDLLRIKGFALVGEHTESPLVIQVSGPIVHDFQTLNKWPNMENKTMLVVITNDVPSSVIHSIFDGFVGNLAIDTADHQALTNNPLAVPGQRF